MSDDRRDELVSNANPNSVELGGQKGLLSPLGDPLGKALNKGLSPVGNAVGGLTQPFGEAGKSKETAKPAGDTGESIGGKEQNGQNPLGL